MTKDGLTTAADLFPLLDALERIKRDLESQIEAKNDLYRVIQWKDKYIKQLEEENVSLRAFD